LPKKKLNVDVEVGLSDDQSKKERFHSLIQVLRVRKIVYFTSCWPIWCIVIWASNTSICEILKQVVGDDLLKERLEIETLESLKLISKKETFNQKYIKIKTRLL
jgi:hypothetical protein